MRIKEKLVHGLGVNDAEYPVYTYAVVGGRQKKMWSCPFHRAWANMLARCYSAKYQDLRPTYSGCSVTQDWHLFSAFRVWMSEQDHEGNQLDKDILFPGNKVYGPQACVFVSSQLNSFMTDGGAGGGELPVGMHRHGPSGKFQARCNNPFTGKREHLGLFTCPDAAHEAWRARKHELACIYADQQADPRIAAALRARYVEIKEVK